MQLISISLGDVPVQARGLHRASWDSKEFIVARGYPEEEVDEDADGQRNPN